MLFLIASFLVHVAVHRMLETMGMELVLKQNFYDFFSEHRNNPEDAHLLYRMAAFDKRTVCSLFPLPCSA